jgi:PAS domain S-box-containing protein
MMFQIATIDDVLRVSLVLVVALIIGLLSTQLRKSKQKIEELSRQLIHDQDNLADRLSLAIQSGAIGIWDWDVSHNTLTWDDRMYELYGITRDRFTNVYDAWASSLHPDDRPMAEEAIQQALRGEKDYSPEFRVIHPDGTIRFIKGYALVQRNDQGEPQHMVGINLDITDRKHAEAALRQNEVALQELNTDLEQRVAERTDELAALNDRLLTVLKEQAQIQAALQASEERRRLVLDLTHIGSWDWHLPSGTMIWNENYFTLLGLVPGKSEPSYELWHSHIHPDDRQWVEQQLLDSIQNHTDYAAEYRVVYPDDSVHWLMARAQGLYDEAGQPLRSLGVLLDISEAKRTEVALQQQTRQNQLLWNITQAMRQSLDLEIILNTTVTQLKPLLAVDRAAVYRFQPDWNGDFIAESVDPNWIKLVNPDVQKIWEDTYLQETQGGRFQQQETFVISDIYTAGLQPCHIDLLEQFQAKAYAVAPIFFAGTLWGLLAIYQNAKARHWQPWEIEVLQQIANQLAIAIKQAELYSQLQIELQERQQATAVLQEAERRWRSLLDNIQLLVVGLDQFGNVSYVNPFFLTLTKYTESEVLGKNWMEHFLASSNSDGVNDTVNDNNDPYHQNSILTKSGEERFIAWNNAILKDSNGAPIGTIGIGEDITERQKLEVMKNEFISIVSHELRTPLTSIQMSLGLLQTGIYAKKPEKTQRMIAIALMDTKRLVNLVNDILDLERLESGRAFLEKTVCSAADLMQQAVDGMYAIATQQCITLTINPTTAMVWAAADTIIQTLTNLLSNAIKFSPPHSVIRLRAERQANKVLFQVRDQGRGIPSDKLETIFGRFQQVDASDSREKGGTGLGLPICRSIIERHGGKIWAESKLGEGCTFFFTLPIPAEFTDDQ